ncbi:hypothetical protein FACS189485_11150 [Spirochaetia bacterium]|nr:hypothetical protein FACS189485_11150 [Spirochaetia bacterium]
MSVTPFIEGDFRENGPFEYEGELDSEHINVSNEENEQDIKKIKLFGLHKFGPGYSFGYYIGLGWFNNDKTQAIYVRPKINNLDYNRMFMSCLESKEVRKHLSSVYDVRLDEKFIIPPQQKNRVNLLPIIIYHYLFLLKKDLIKKPLMKAYINRQENLKAKVKGKIMVSSHIKKNISNYREDRIMCFFDEYSPDCPANRLLHSAYKMGIQYLKTVEQMQERDAVEYSSIEKYFDEIGYLHSYSETAKIKTNPLYMHYKEPLRLAKIIYRYFTYQYETNDKTVQANKPMPPFIINMATLFELYVYTKLLKTGHSIEYHPRGNGGEEPDFIDKTENSEMIIDTKYKEIYTTNSYDRADIRQLSGYARDTEILKKIFGKVKDTQGNPAWDTILDCLIVYPDMDNGLDKIPEDFNLEMKNHKIENFHKFYKLGTKLPEMGTAAGSRDQA